MITIALKGIDKTFALLDRLERQQNQVLRQAVIAARKTIPVLVERQFDQEISPEGSMWKPRKDGKPGKLLAGLKSGFRYQETASSVLVSHDKFYAKFHQTGTQKMTDRSFLPTEKIPKSWNELRVAVKQAIDGVFHVR